MEKVGTILLNPEDVLQALREITEQKRSMIWSNVSVLRDIPKDRKISRQAALSSKLGRAIANHAYERKINLNDGQWVPPDSLAPHAKRLSALFNSIAIPENFIEWQAQNRKELVERLSASEEFRKAALAWPHDESIRPALIAMVTDSHHEIYGRDLYYAPNMVFDYYSEGKLNDGSDEHYIRGSFAPSYDPETRTRQWIFSYNTHPDTDFQNFLLAMNIVHHENTHAGQDAFDRLQGTHRIKPDHPLYEAALLWHELRAYRHNYFKNVRPLYYNIPSEVDAFRQGGLFAAELKEALAKHGVELPPQPPFPVIPPGLR